MPWPDLLQSVIVEAKLLFFFFHSRCFKSAERANGTGGKTTSEWCAGQGYSARPHWPRVTGSLLERSHHVLLIAKSPPDSDAAVTLAPTFGFPDDTAVSAGLWPALNNAY